MVAKDLINKQLTGYNDILPTKTFFKTVANLSSYIMTYKKKEGIITEVMVNVNRATDTPTAAFVYERKVGVVAAPVAPTRIYTSQDVATTSKSSYFIPAAVAIAKLPLKYASANIYSIGTNEQDPNIIYYDVVYNMSGKFYEIEVLTKKKLRTSQILS